MKKERITKDTAKINKFNNKNYQFSIDDNALASNEKKNKKDLRESRKAGSISPTSVEKHLKDFVENAEKYRGNKEKYERITGKQLVENKSYIEQKKTDNKLYPYNNKSLSSSKEQKNTLKNELEIHPERSDKEVALKTELQDHKLQIEPTNASLQNLLATLKGNNKITVQEQPNAVIKNNKPKTSKKSLFSATVFYSPDIVFSKVDNDHHTFREEDRNEIKNKEEIKKTYSTGVLINYNTGNKLSIQSGLTFSAMATDIKPKTIYARTDDRGNLNYRFNCSAGYSYVSLHSGIRPAAAGDSISASSSKNLLHYITVPLALKYNLTEGKFGLSTGLGAAINLLTKGKIETVIGNEKASINHIEGLSSMYLNSAISFGMNYEINQNIALSLTPAAKFALTSINKNAPVKTYLNSYGLAAGLTIKL
ncbi:MAG: outer membrane beta-barrel protein [Segetibacter sp.]